MRAPLAPVTDVRAQDVAAVRECLDSGWWTMGPRTQAFEAALADALDAPHGVALASGAAAVQLACQAVGARDGTEVVAAALAPRSTHGAIRATGARLVPADVLAPDEPFLDPEAAAAALSASTRAVVVTHLLGRAAPVEPLRALCDERGVALVEDVGAAIGLRVAGGKAAGTIGELGAFALDDPGLVAVGQGGAVLARDADHAARVRLLRSHALTSGTWDRHRGHSETYDVVDLGYNHRIDEARAALAHSMLGRLEEGIARRRAGQGRLAAALEQRAVEGVPARAPELSAPLWLGLLLDDERSVEAVAAALRVAGAVSPGLGVAPEHGDAPRARDAARRLCPLPVVEGEAAVAAVVEAVEQGLGREGERSWKRSSRVSPPEGE